MADAIANPISSLPTARVFPTEQEIFGLSQPMRAVRERLEKVVSADVPLLLEGAGGTGKEVLARWIHARSPWQSGQFVKINCAAIPGPLLESELFGYEKGAFTGAQRAKPGGVEMAKGGTLFLDEIGELDLSLQAKLLHLLQDGRFCRIGDVTDRQLECRVIFATSRDLKREAAEGRFRPDLFYRINVIRIALPSLRERRGDIPLLVNHFLVSLSRRFEKAVPSISREKLRYLQERDWLGNIRELENCIARYVVLGSEDVLWGDPMERREAPAALRSLGDGPVSLKQSAKEAIREMERRVILKALQENHWNRRRTAAALNISYRALMYKMRQARLINGGAPGAQSFSSRKSPSGPD